MSAKNLVDKDCVRNFGGVNNTDLWTDPWVYANNISYFGEDLIPTDQRLNNFSNIMDSTRNWKVDILNILFEPLRRDAVLIKVYEKINNIVWIYTKNGNYTTKTFKEVYKLIKRDDGSSSTLDWYL